MEILRGSGEWRIGGPKVVVSPGHGLGIIEFREMTVIVVLPGGTRTVAIVDFVVSLEKKYEAGFRDMQRLLENLFL